METTGIDVEEITYDVKSESAQLLLGVYAGNIQVRLRIDISKEAYDAIVLARNVALDALNIFTGKA